MGINFKYEMTYKETVEYLYNSTPVFEHVGASAYKEGLDNTLALDAHFGHPHRAYKTIHVAGTNGKGSCSHTLAAVLQSMGLKVGLYTSPHLVDFRERIRVNGQMISEDEVISFVEKERAFFEPLHPSFFELTTALAFKYFKDQRVDVAVVEVGLGGRLDCTNIITPQISVITNISMDHTQFLGNTLAQIAREKAGIIKHGVPVIIGEAVDETRPVFLEKAAEMQALIFFAEDESELMQMNDSTAIIHGLTEGGIDYETKSFGRLHGELGGLYQERNTNTVLCTLRHLGITDKEAVRRGFANVCELTGLMGRWQVLRERPRVVCDTGHNVGGWQYLSRQIRAQECKTLRIVFGMVDDKDIDSVMEMLPKWAVYYFTQPSSHRAFPVKTVIERARKHGLQGDSFQSVMEAYKAALGESGPEDFIFVGGSSYVVADLLSGF